ncbi:thiol-disulfide oxidoreductase DCC family protein [Priestia endophytica]|uniref:thiol-disulfide oxidoreductase DCC family protein n=1 Tax=Priestia endophytica TaxID=135735 RepID=UPI00228130F9|nr:thiol-disulfide oxidoreductase DCC family protein [Priestia endophytica]MCY8235159.1 thiol-disulfide oxidoreductase DCC family protein [Priestia endophytica]
MKDNHDILVLFDGVCNMCNRFVQSVIKRDPKGIFKFASLQSNTGSSILNQYGYRKDLHSIVLIDGDTLYTESTAILHIISNLTGPVRILSLFKIVPKPLRDRLYQFGAKYRYRLFGKQTSCMIPTEEIKSRFIDLNE